MHNEAKITDRESPISTISARWGKSADAGYFPAKAKQMGDGIFLPKQNKRYVENYGAYFYADRFKFYNAEQRTYRLEEIKAFLTEQHIALYDTATRVRRLKDNASDKFLEIVETIDLKAFSPLAQRLRRWLRQGRRPRA